MNAAIGIGMLLVGGWVLPSLDPLAERPGFSVVPRASAESGQRPGATGRAAAPTAPSVPGAARDDYGRPAAPMGSAASRPVATQPNMTVAPTDPSLGDPLFPVQPPTSDAPLPDPRYGGSPTGPGGYFGPRSYGSGYRPGPSSPGYRGSQSGGSQWSRYRQAARPSAASTGGKAFSGYRPQPAISPYMNMYRTDNALGTIDNYNTLVRPMLEQRSLNQQFGSELRGLESSSRRQGSAIQRLGRETQYLQGTTSPQYYMNYHEYYPSFGN